MCSNVTTNNWHSDNNMLQLMLYSDILSVKLMIFQRPVL